MDKSILLLVNPVSGNGKNLENHQYILTQLELKNWQVFSFISEKKGDFINFLQENNLEKYSHLGVVGGDGTMHEVVNGLLLNEQPKQIPIILFPCGSGNALNHDLRCFSIDEALIRLNNGHTRKIDTIKVRANGEVHFAISIIGFGIVNDINKRAENMRWLGGLRYTVASLVDIFRNPNYEAEVIVDNIKYEGNFCFVLISNTIHTGKGMKMAPLALLSDGLLDVLVVKHLSIWQLLLLFPKIFSGTHITSPMVKHIYAKAVNIFPKTQQIGNFDGEVKGYSPFEVAIIPKSIEIIC